MDGPKHMLGSAVVGGVLLGLIKGMGTLLNQMMNEQLNLLILKMYHKILIKGRGLTKGQTMKRNNQQNMRHKLILVFKFNMRKSDRYSDSEVLVGHFLDYFMPLNILASFLDHFST